MQPKRIIQQVIFFLCFFSLLLFFFLGKVHACFVFFSLGTKWRKNKRACLKARPAPIPCSAYASQGKSGGGPPRLAGSPPPPGRGENVRLVAQYPARLTPRRAKVAAVLPALRGPPRRQATSRNVFLVQRRLKKIFFKNKWLRLRLAPPKPVKM